MTYAVDYWCCGRWLRLMPLCGSLKSARRLAKAHFTAQPKPKRRIVEIGTRERIVAHLEDAT